MLCNLPSSAGLEEPLLSELLESVCARSGVVITLARNRSASLDAVGFGRSPIPFLRLVLVRNREGRQANRRFPSRLRLRSSASASSPWVSAVIAPPAAALRRRPHRCPRLVCDGSNSRCSRLNAGYLRQKYGGSSPCQSQSSRRGAASGQRAPRPKSPKQGAENFAVIPGRPLGPGPEFKNTGQTIDFISLCSWIPGSRAKPAPRNDHPSAFFP